MARKHFDEYYNKICSQFFSLKEVFDDLSKEVDRLKSERKEICEKVNYSVDGMNSGRVVDFICEKSKL